MHLIFIRHGDPNYEIDSVTDKGRREIDLLAKRTSSWKVTEAFVSPMGRAQVTAEAALGNKAVLKTLPWLREFSYPVVDPLTKKDHIPWDWLPRQYFGEKKYFDSKKWFSAKAMKSGNIEKLYREVCEGIDSILQEYDYARTSPELPVYNCFPHMTPAEAAVDTHLNAEQKDLDETNLVFVCHFGVMCAIISHLTGFSPMQLWQSFFAAPSSVTVLGAEERVPGEVWFRIQQFGDVTHLVSGGETVSASGFFGNCITY